MMSRWSLAVIAAVLGLPLPADRAQAQAAGWLQAEAYYHNVTNDFGDWKGIAFRAVVPSGFRNIWYGDLLIQEAFEDGGVYAVVANRHVFSPSWFSFASLGGGTGDFYFPDLRADAGVGRVWGSSNLVTTLGATYVNSKDVYEDFALNATVATYLRGVTLEAGGRLNWSSPESVNSERIFGAVTVGRERQRLIVARVGTGTEAYQLTGDVQTQRRFSSTEVALSWRQWLNRRVGVFVGGEWYDNPFYTRTGVTLGVFRHW
jgi:YaiO family outer membrane protein